jgi:hypothetical protein
MLAAIAVLAAVIASPARAGTSTGAVGGAGKPNTGAIKGQPLFRHR